MSQVVHQSFLARLVPWWASVRSVIYDRLITSFTSNWYQTVLQEIPSKSKLLDVGIGTGAALCKNAKLLEKKDINVIGIDIDGDYLKSCRENLASQSLDSRVQCILASATDFNQGEYESIYFSGSFMIIPPNLRVDMLKNMKNHLLKDVPEAAVYFTQNFQEKESYFVKVIKPWLSYLTTIEFGQVTYEAEFKECLDVSGYEIIKTKVLSQSPGRSARLIVAKPKS
mmetsp:Transcript_4235/g.6324  ORF Transcript_4235/g.6324 Transcript_4235/m.6324 type:complete len:226 (+) Transcript_4235:56-733(+)